MRRVNHLADTRIITLAPPLDVSDVSQLIQQEICFLGIIGFILMHRC